MKIALASDLHGNWFGLDFQPADLLIIAGDILGQYVTNKKWNAKEQLDELKQLNWYLSKFNYEKVISIRKENLLSIHSQLGYLNEFNVNLDSPTHIYYPFLIYWDKYQKIFKKYDY